MMMIITHFDRQTLSFSESEKVKVYSNSNNNGAAKYTETSVHVCPSTMTQLDYSTRRKERKKETKFNVRGWLLTHA